MRGGPSRFKMLATDSLLIGVERPQQGLRQIYAIQRAEFRVGDYGFQGPDPATRVLPDRIVHVGDEVLDTVFRANLTSLVSTGAVEERDDRRDHCLAGRGVAAQFGAAPGLVRRNDGLMVNIDHIDVLPEGFRATGIELHHCIAGNGRVQVVISDGRDPGLMRQTVIRRIGKQENTEAQHACDIEGTKCAEGGEDLCGLMISHC